MNTPRILRSLTIVGVLALAVALGSGCKSAGEKKYDEAKALQKRGLNAQAITVYEEAGKLLTTEQNEPGRAWEKLSSIYKGEQNYDEAEKYIRMAIEDDPEDFERYARLMSVLRLTNRFDEAREVYAGIIDHPNLRFELKDKERLEDERQRVDVAEEQYKRDQAEAAAEAAAAGAGEATTEAPETAGDEADASAAAPAGDDAATAPEAGAAGEAAE